MARIRVLFPVAAFIAGLFCVALPAVSGDDQARLLENLEKRYRGVKTLTAEFKQRDRIVTLGGVRESGGTLVLKRPGKMRWDYRSGEQQTMVTDGTTLWIYRIEEQTVYRLPFDREEASRSPVALLFQEGRSLLEFFSQGKVAPAEGGLVRIELVPRQPSLELAALSLLVKPEGPVLAGTVMKDLYGNVTEITFGEQHEGVLVDDRLFTFTVPPGVKVLTSRQAVAQP